MSTKTGFTTYTAEKIYELDGIYASDVAAIAQLKGFPTHLSENQRSEVNQFVKKAKERNLTTKQAVQLASEVQQSTPPTQQQEQQTDPVGAVTEKVSNQSVLAQSAALRKAMAEAENELAIKEVAKDLAIAKFLTSGGDLSHRPDLQLILGQSKAIRNAAEATNATLLPLEQIVLLAMEDAPIFAGKLPALPTTATRMLSAEDVNP